MTTGLLFRNDAYLKSASARVVAVHERGIELDCTTFYSQGGGQVGDSGAPLRADGERIAIADTRKGEALDRVISPDKGRLDFDIDMSLLDGANIERDANALIARRRAGSTAQDTGHRPAAMRRTHVRNIAGIGAIRVLRIRSEGKRNKRVEIALTA